MFQKEKMMPKQKGEMGEIKRKIITSVDKILFPGYILIIKRNHHFKNKLAKGKFNGD